MKNKILSIVLSFLSLLILSNAVSALDTPTNVNVSSSFNNLILFTWSSVPNATGYIIEVISFKEGNWIRIADIKNATQFLLMEGITPRTNYTFRIHAYNQFERSNYSNLLPIFTTYSKKTYSGEFNNNYISNSSYSYISSLTNEYWSFTNNQDTDTWQNAQPYNGAHGRQIFSYTPTEGEVDTRDVSYNIGCLNNSCLATGSSVPEDLFPQDGNVTYDYPYELMNNPENEYINTPFGGVLVPIPFRYEGFGSSINSTNVTTSCNGRDTLQNIRMGNYNFSYISPGETSGQSSISSITEVYAETCANFAPICSTYNTSLSKCECNNNKGQDAGVYPEETIALKDIVSFSTGFTDDYIAFAETTRGFTPSGDPTPFDTFYYEITVKLCPHLGYSAPQYLNFVPSIVADGVTVLKGDLTSFKKYSENLDEVKYRWILTGWQTNQYQSVAPKGILNVDYDEAGSQIRNDILINAANENKPIVLNLDKLSYNGSAIASKKFSVNFSTCLQMQGDSLDIPVIFMQGKSLYEFSPAISTKLFILTKVKQTIYNGFLSTDPFKAYNSSFSFYVDLVRHPDSTFGMHWNYDKPMSISSCNAKVKGTHNIYSFLIGSKAKASSKISSQVFYVTTENSGTTDYLHELGHAFGGLGDEYDLGLVRKYPTGWLGKNCVWWPNIPQAYSFSSVLYGDTNILGCTDYHYPTGNQADIYHRPSSNSIMNENGDSALKGQNRFNVISCGYILQAIKGKNQGPANQYFPECATPSWNTIKLGEVLQLQT